MNPISLVFGKNAACNISDNWIFFTFFQSFYQQKLVCINFTPVWKNPLFSPTIFGLIG
jgi:hypothetical protein